MRGTTGRVFLSGLVLAYAGGYVLHRLHAGAHEAHDINPWIHWLRDSTLALAPALVVVLLATILSRSVVPRLGIAGNVAWERLTWVLAVAVGYAAFSVPGNLVHGSTFGASHEGMGLVEHLAADGFATLGASLGIFAVLVLLIGTPWERRPPHVRLVSSLRAHGARGALALGIGSVLDRRWRVGPALLGAVTIAAVAAVVPRVGGADAATAVTGCAGFDGTRTITADVVALEQKFFYNRLGVQAGANPDPYGLMYALRRDVVVKDPTKPFGPGNVQLREGKRPRPLVLRMNVGDCLEISFQNLLSLSAKDDHPADRHVGIHVNGMQMGGEALGGIDNDGSFVGKNDSGLVQPGGRANYTLFAEYENTYLLYSLGTPVGGEGLNASIALGLFGAVNVEPFGTEWYRSQVTREEMDWAKTGTASTGQPLLDYSAVYPTGAGEGRDGLPILSMLQGDEIVHSDLNAIITGPDRGPILRQSYPAQYWQNENYNQYRDRGEEPFREFTVIFHDEIKAVQAFPEFADPVLGHTLHGVRDGFAVNYGTGGIGAEILANRKGVGPMGKCIECKYEEFFLSSWMVGDPAMVVDKPANAIPYVPATKALYPDDPANVHHSYLNDRVKFRNLHAGPKEHHIFHLHAHQWQYDWNEERSAYLDSQNIGPGGGFTYEIAHGGSGNRNKTAGDSIFHCHFYPHFAQGMWELWRVHDTFEIGTALDEDGRPAAGSRAFPDGEITAGTPIPGVVPLPGMAMAPMPSASTTVIPYDLDQDGNFDSSQINADGDLLADVDEIAGGEAFAIEANGAGLGGKNPGYPFFVPGVAGHRPPTPPMDLKEDGGLERHIVVDGTAESFKTRLDMNRELKTASVVYLPEEGTPAEQAAMTFHSQAGHGTSTTGGTAGSFETNGLPAVPGAPFADPCRPDHRTTDPATGWVNPVNGGVAERVPTGTRRPYKAAVIELDATLNKLGWHFPQQRILALNRDVGPALAGTRAPEPLVMRLNVGDCATFEHTNLVPNVYELDDYQVRTPTDIIGQHIHLVKFDVLSADGSANGFNYEDGTLSPEEVEERIHAVREQTNLENPGTCTGDARQDGQEAVTLECPLAVKHPYFGTVAGVGDLAWGARTTVQRWYADPVLNNSWDQGVGSVFTHDHYGPSTHQQVGLYATVLVEPEGSTWRHSQPGTDGKPVMMGSREDGGPTSWRADILLPNEPNGTNNSFREFYLEYSDFQHAYEKDGGALGEQSNEAVDAVTIPSYADFGSVVNPSFRLEPPSGHKKDLFWFPPNCPGGGARPCPEAISADDPGTYVVNYRNEPLAARIFGPTSKTQATGPRGDLSRAFESRTDRAWEKLRTQPSVYPPLTPDVRPGDPFTPLLPVYQGDKVRLRVQVGGQEEEHNFTLHGLKWMHEPRNDDSGWRAGSPSGISEYFNLEMPMTPDLSTGQSNKNTDYVWEAGAQTEGRWNGIWGLMRSYGKARGDLQKLPNNQIPTTGWTISNLNEFTQACPKKTNGTQTPTRRYSVTAVRAKKVLNDNPLVYNDRGSKLVDPNALLYVFSDDLVRDSSGNITGLKPGTPLEPLVLRAAAGDCIKVDLENALPPTESGAVQGVEDHDGFNSLPPIIRKNEVNGGFTTFNANDIRPSNRVGLAAQLVAYDVRKSGGLEVGADNGPNTVGPGESKQYTWYAGQLDYDPDVAGKLKIKATPVEFGAVNLMASDPIKGASKGLVGALVIEPPGASWETDGDSNVSATVRYPHDGGQKSFREFVTVLQDDLNLRKGGCDGDWDECAIPNVNGEGGGFPEDPQDSGQKGINYGAEPLWHRLGIPANTPFESPALLGSTNVHKAFSNTLVGGEDPQTAVFAASPDAGPTSIRMRLVQPGGHARGHEFTVHGHAWQRQPYIDASTRLNTDFHGDPTLLCEGGTATGQDCEGAPQPPSMSDHHNMTSWWISSQEGMGPTLHYDLMFKERGGEFTTEGDYLFRDFGSFGTFQGLWGIMRVDLTPAIATRDAFIAPPNATFQASAAAGVKANDLDLDGNPLPAAVVTASVKNGTLSLAADGSFSYTPKAGFIGRDAFTYRLGGPGGATAVAEIRVRSNPPSTGTDYAAVAAGSSEVVIPVLANDTDPEGDQLKLIITEDDLVKVERIQGTSAKGAVFPYGATSVRYAPYAGVTGTDAFKYTVEDATGNRVTGTVYVTITSGGEGSVTVSSVVWSKKDAKWTIKGSTGTLEVQKTTSTSAVLGTTTIGSASVVAIPDGKAWQIGPTANVAPKSCGEKVTVKSALGPTITGVPITCK